ncbi:hypothetical protein V2J09_015748 [Rumex salicifolius]
MNPKHFLSSLLFLGILAISLQPSLVAGVNVASVVTPKFFNSIISQAGFGCKGKSFYTRAGFLNAVKSFPKFGHHFCYIEEINKSKYCFNTCKCNAKKSYYGRGPIQLTWNCNYAAAGRYLGLDLVNHPELVATSPSVSFKASLWYWKSRVESHLDEGFAGTIRAINGGECRGGNRAAVANRVKYYKKYCKAFEITPGPNLYC